MNGSLAIVIPFLDGRHLLGLEREAIELANELDRRGCVVEVITSTRSWRGGSADDPAELNPKVTLTRLQGYLATRAVGLQPSGAPLVIPHLKRYVLRHDACVIFNAGWPLTLALSRVLWSPMPLLYRTYWHPPCGRINRLNNLRVEAARFAFRHATLLLTPTLEEAELLLELGLAQEDHVRVIEPGVSRPPSLGIERGDVRLRLGVPEGAVLVTQIGSPSVFKGTPTLVEAARLVRARGVDLHLALVGRVPKGEPTASTPDELWVHRLGPLPDSEKSEVLTASDGLAMLSEYESYGFAAIEALSHGVCPVIYDDFPSSMQLQSWGAIGISRSDGAAAVADALLHAASAAVSGASLRSWADYADGVVAALSEAPPRRLDFVP